MDINTIMQNISVIILPLLMAITLHEAGHAYAAYYLGDDTAARQGRLSLNPVVHIDPVGTVLIPVMLLLLSVPFLFGYAKPVPVNVGRLRKPKRDDIIVSLAGPVANIILAFFFAIVLKIGISMGSRPDEWLFEMARFGIIINCVLAVFNLLPIPPLDGGRVLQALLPYKQAQSFRQVGRFGFFIVIGIIFWLPAVIQVPINFFYELVKSIMGLG